MMIFALTALINLAHAGCSKDTDCKGDRVCNSGNCEDEVPPTASSKSPATAASAPLTAGGCPWAGKEAPVVASTMTTVTVNGVVYAVKGKAARTAFATTLHACAADAAVPEFDKWRASRRSVNMFAITGSSLIVTGSLLDAVSYGSTYGLCEGIGSVDLAVGIPVMATQADKHRRLMMTAIMTSKPPRK